MARTRRGLLAGVALTVLVALGAGVAVVLGDELGIRSEPADIPAETLVAAPETLAVAPPAFTRVAAPPSLRMDLAVEELDAAVADAGTTVGTTTLDVVVGDGDADDESYRLEGTADALTVVAASEAGATLGVYDLAAAVRDRRPVTEHLGETVESRLGFRMVDLGAVGVAVDEPAWAAGDDYSHNSKAFADVILADAPYIDEAALEVARDDFESYVRHALAEGYNAIAIPGFIEYLTFSGVGDGTRCTTPTTRTSPARTPCGTRSGRCGSGRTTPASTCTSAPTCSRSRRRSRSTSSTGSAASPPTTRRSGTSTRRASTSSTRRCRTSTACSSASARPAGSTTCPGGTTTPSSPSRASSRCGRCSRRSPSRPSASTAR